VTPWPYEPLLGPVGAAPDRAVLRRVAAATMASQLREGGPAPAARGARPAR
jgi:hypothetical protein